MSEHFTYRKLLRFVFPSIIMMITAGKSQLGLFVIIAAGLTNIILDYLFIVVFDWGLQGAAWATVLGQTVGSMIPICLFCTPKQQQFKTDKGKVKNLGSTSYLR